MIKSMHYNEQSTRCVGVTGVYIVWFSVVQEICAVMLDSISRGEVRGKSHSYSHRLHQRLTEKLQYSPSSCHLESESISQWDFKPAFSQWVTGAGLNDGSTELLWIRSQKESKWDAKRTSSLCAAQKDSFPCFSPTTEMRPSFADVSGTSRASFRI